jgi:hypothetical protein
MIEPFNFRPETTKGLPAASCELRADHESFTICWLAAQIQILRTVAQNDCRCWSHALARLRLSFAFLDDLKFLPKLEHAAGRKHAAEVYAGINHAIAANDRAWVDHSVAANLCTVADDRAEFS